MLCSMGGSVAQSSLRPVGVGLHVADERQVRRTAVGIAVGPTQFASRRQLGDGLRRMVVDVVGHHLAVGRTLVGDLDVVAVVDRGPHRAVGCDGQSGAVADAGRERRVGPAARRNPHDGGPLAGWRCGPRRRCCRSSRSRSTRRHRVPRRRSSGRARRRRPGRGSRVGQVRRRRCAGRWPRRRRSRRRRPDRSRRRRAWSPANARPCGWFMPSTRSCICGPDARGLACGSPARRWAPRPAGRRPAPTPPAAASAPWPTPTSSSPWAPTPFAARRTARRRGRRGPGRSPRRDRLRWAPGSRCVVAPTPAGCSTSTPPAPGRRSARRPRRARLTPQPNSHASPRPGFRTVRSR